MFEKILHWQENSIYPPIFSNDMIIEEHLLSQGPIIKQSIGLYILATIHSEFKDKENQNIIP